MGAQWVGEWKAGGLQVGLGKIPNSEMMKLVTRKGDMFSCGWLPPVMPMV